MSLLKYTSDEMFSSTELIRKSKTVFDKIHYEDIEKAVILRDGKPSFILMDFTKYEALINEYIKLKEQIKNKKEHIIDEKHNKVLDNKKVNTKDIESNDLEKAFKDIENIDLNKMEIKSKEVKTEALKDFWE